MTTMAEIEKAVDEFEEAVHVVEESWHAYCKDH